ncbi:MAG: cyclic pyranopterin monophosphate synthase MoaC [Tissierellia bacterium]|nr:cyclic pyranopterin monophosphate synthase MoaC [Tissierellia bacterium]
MEFTHLDKEGRGHMVDVGEKADTLRIATAEGTIRMAEETAAKMKAGPLKKGDVLSVAQIAAVMGAKKTPELIPLCHPLFLTGVDVEFFWLHDGIRVRTTCKTVGKTGVEMEALTAAATALLTIYDMGKAVDKQMKMESIVLLEKDGGRSGHFVHTEPRVVGINISETKGVVKTPVKEGEFLVGHGLQGDAHAGDWHRMVSLLGLESYDKMKNEASERLAQGSFAENITTEGIVLYELPVGTVLQIGETVHEVTQIGKKCHTGCQIKSLVGDCVMPREGIFTKLLSSGTIREGDPIRIIKKGSAE